MSKTWYYARDNQQFGPVEEGEIKQLVAFGELGPNDLVWKVGDPDWLPVGEIPELRGGPPAAAPSSPPVYAVSPPPPPPPPAASPFAAPAKKKDEALRPAADRPAAAPPSGESPADAVRLHLSRVLRWNLRTIPITKAEEAQLAAGYVGDDAAQRYLVWRRSLLLVTAGVTAAAALFAFIDLFASSWGNFSRFGVVLIIFQAFALLALPVAANMAALNWDRYRRSHYLLLVGAAVAFLVPILTALLPGNLWTDAGSSKLEVRAGVGFGVLFLIALYPTLLSVGPAFCRACVRMKGLSPTSVVPGWGLLVGGPVQVFIFLAAFVFMFSLAGNFLLIVGALLVFAAPLVYLGKPELMTRPLIGTEPIAALGKQHRTATIVAAVGVAFLVLYLFTAKFFDKHLLGFGSDSWMGPWNPGLHKFWLEWLGRSLFLTALFADLLMRADLAVWRNERAFRALPQSAEVDQTMESQASIFEPSELGR